MNVLCRLSGSYYRVRTSRSACTRSAQLRCTHTHTHTLFRPSQAPGKRRVLPPDTRTARPLIFKSLTSTPLFELCFDTQSTSSASKLLLATQQPTNPTHLVIYSFFPGPRPLPFPRLFLHILSSARRGRPPSPCFFRSSSSTLSPLILHPRGLRLAGHQPRCRAVDSYATSLSLAV